MPDSVAVPDGISNSGRVNVTTKSMPYNIQKRGSNFVVVKKYGDRPKVVAGNRTKLSREQALASMRARYHAESGRPFTRREPRAYTQA